MKVEAGRPWVDAAAVFVVCFVLFWWLIGDRIGLDFDEGIYLSDAARIVRGEVIYRDFAALTGPVCFWILALAYSIGGVTLAAARCVLCGEMALLAALLYLLGRHLSTRAAAFAGVGIFLVMTAFRASPVMNNHRWDAAVFAVAGLLAVCRGWGVLGGLLLAGAVWATPTLAWTALCAVALARLVGSSPWRVMAGGAAGAALGLGALAATGAFGAFFETMRWLGENYTGLNYSPYGSLNGGLGQFFAGVEGTANRALIGFLVAGQLMPGWLPVLVLGAVAMNRERVRIFLAVCGVAMIASAWPKLDIGHILFSVPVFCPLAAAYLPGRWPWSTPVVAYGAIAVVMAVASGSGLERLVTPFGTARMTAEDAADVRWLGERLRPGSTSFVYPFPAQVYVLTDTRNVTRYSFLHPQQLSVAGERQAIEDLSMRRPRQIVILRLPAEILLRLWPSTDPDKTRLRALDAWVEANYTSVGSHGMYELFEPRK